MPIVRKYKVRRTPNKRAITGLLILLATLLGMLGFAAPSQAIAGTSVTWNARQEGIPDAVRLIITVPGGNQYYQSYQTTRNNVQTTCPPHDGYKLQIPGANNQGTRFLEPGQCQTWNYAGARNVGLFRADYGTTPPSDEWPNASNTGFQGNASALPERRGWKVTTPGTVIENLRIDSTDSALTIAAANVTIRNVVVEAGIWGIDLLGSADGVVIEDSTITGGLQAGIGVDHPDNWLIQRVNVSGGNDAIKPGGSGILRDSYLHDLGSIGSDPHNDALQFGNAWGIDILHNTMECKDTSCIAMFGGQAEFDDVTIDRNKMGGAGYTIYAGGETGTNIRITNNVFGSYGYQHPVTDWDYKPGHVFSGNVFTNGSPVPTPTG